MRIRGFEPISGYSGKELLLPKRKTVYSAGYDIYSAEDATLLALTTTLIPTGLKAYMQPDEYLGLHMRSGLAVKYNLSLINGQGIIDADYYNNESNEGHILIAVFNHNPKEIFISKGTRIVQAIFYKYLIADGDNEQGKMKRIGGLGSTGR